MTRRLTVPRVITGTAPCFVLVPFLLLPPAGSAQQTDVAHFDSYVGYAFLYSPRVALFENEAQFQFGYRPNTWMSLGFDYSVSKGTLTLTHPTC
jgi:hypothetical protein